MKFIVTGGLGFIGHNVVRFLEQQGHNCYIIDSMTNYGFVPQDELDYLIGGRRARIDSPIFNIDIRDIEQTQQWFDLHSSSIDGIIHLASFPRQKIVSQQPVWGSEVMSTALINLLELSKQYKIPKFVYVSSSMVYGDFDNDVTELSPCNPIGQYGIMKYMGEQLVKDYNRRGCFDYSIIRPSAVYGEWDVEDRVVSKFMLGALRGQTLTVKGSQEVLDFTHVSDTAMGIVLAATKSQANNKIYNITRADTELHTLLDAAQLAVDIVGKGRIKIDDKDQEFPSRGRLSIDSAILDLGYIPRTNIEQGFKQYYDWFVSSSYWSKQL